MIEDSKETKKHTTIKFLIYFLYVMHFFGVIGILSDFRETFLDLTPLTILITFIIIIYSIPNRNKTTIICISTAFVIGFIAEYLGVNYGLIFGKYTYGDNLGPKILGVPPLIGINWAILSYCTATMTSFMKINTFVKAVTGALLMTSIDLFIEPVAPKTDYWYFEAGIAPVQNYFGWFFVSLIVQIVFQRSDFSKNFYVANNVLVVQTLFFVLLNIII
ncbi:carotenoid biosynthesis protein [Marinigracilibium pacificum]|uniref:Carotenoid biosynthesis protein n=1 Tax=Marinigracilibium pacificum TaxID=2729599 RepID=A0A848J7B9_9BACT|nr:carotenoid biosynthesis protein [Marinigracilibium pacificum]NMM50289.1 carotenoid biosynthesis protein [Marinigracilibium pacificum]